MDFASGPQCWWFQSVKPAQSHTMGWLGCENKSKDQVISADLRRLSLHKCTKWQLSFLNLSTQLKAFRPIFHCWQDKNNSIHLNSPAHSSHFVMIWLKFVQVWILTQLYQHPCLLSTVLISKLVDERAYLLSGHWVRVFWTECPSLSPHSSPRRCNFSYLVLSI